MSNGALPLEALRVIHWDDILAHMETRADVVDPVYIELLRRDDATFGRPLGPPPNIEALTGFAERRRSEFAAVDAATVIEAG